MDKNGKSTTVYKRDDAQAHPSRIPTLTAAPSDPTAPQQYEITQFNALIAEIHGNKSVAKNHGVLLSRWDHNLLTLAMELATSEIRQTRRLARNEIEKWLLYLDRYTDRMPNTEGCNATTKLSDQLVPLQQATIIMQDLGDTEDIDIICYTARRFSAHVSRREVSNDEYWRGLVALAIINVSGSDKEMAQFVRWVADKDAREIIDIAKERHTIIVDTLQPVLDDRGVTHRSLFDGIL